MIDEEEQQKWDTVVSTLAKLTVAGSIKWAPIKPGSRGGGPEEQGIKGMIYEGEYSGRTVFVFEYEYDRWLGPDESVVQSEIAVELAGKNSQATWRLPATGSHRELLDAIRRRAVEADDFADTVIHASKRMS